MIKLLCCSLFLFQTTSAQGLTIYNDQGGKLNDYVTKVMFLKKTNQFVKFTGECNSACTLYLYLPADRLCITKNASFGFHAAYGRSKEDNETATQFMYSSYPSWVQDWVTRNGGLTKREITMKYDYASKHLKGC